MPRHPFLGLEFESVADRNWFVHGVWYSPCMEVRTSCLVIDILKDPKTRHEFYKLAWNGGGSLRVGDKVYKITSLDSDRPDYWKDVE